MNNIAELTTGLRTKEVWRGTRPQIATRLHPQLVQVLKKISKRNKWPMSVVLDEVIYHGLKASGEIDEGF